IKIPAELLPEILKRPFVDEGTPARIVEADAPSMVVPVLAATLTVLWMLGIVLGLCRLASAFAKQRRVMVGQPWRPGFWTDELTSKLAGKLGLRKFPEVHLSPAAPMPMVVGLWRPQIFLPEMAPATWGQPQWEAVLLHEAAHIARHDPWA